MTAGVPSSAADDHLEGAGRFATELRGDQVEVVLG